MTNSKHIIHRNLPEIILTILVGIVVFSSANTFHDWGGDFAQYLDNARDLVSGQKNQQNEVLDSINFAPTTRGSGFSLMLSSIFLVFGGEIIFFTTFLSFIFLSGILVLYWYYLKFELNKSLAFLLSLAFALHPEVLALKFEILPTFPFLVLLYLFFLNEKSIYSNQLWLVALLAGLLVSFRNVGWVLYISIMIHLGIAATKGLKRTELIRLIGFAMIVPGVEFITKWIVFGTPTSENLSWYQQAFHLNDQLVFWNRLLYYYDQFLIVFKPGYLGAFALPFSKFMIILAFIGWCCRVYRKHWSIADTFVICYGILLILYEGVSGIRFLIPVLPIVLLYWTTGVHFVLIKLNERTINKVRMTLIFGFILLYLPNTIALIQKAKSPISGPNNSDAQEAFSYVRNSISEHEATAFHKPWVFHYYTDRTSMAINPKNGRDRLSMDYLVDKMTRFKVDYLLLSISPADFAIYDESFIIAIQTDKRFTEQWRNNSFVFLSLNVDKIETGIPY